MAGQRCPSPCYQSIIYYRLFPVCQRSPPTHKRAFDRSSTDEVAWFVTTTEPRTLSRTNSLRLACPSVPCACPVGPHLSCIVRTWNPSQQVPLSFTLPLGCSVMPPRRCARGTENGHWKFVQLRCPPAFRHVFSKQWNKWLQPPGRTAFSSLSSGQQVVNESYTIHRQQQQGPPIERLTQGWASFRKRMDRLRQASLGTYVQLVTIMISDIPRRKIAGKRKCVLNRCRERCGVVKDNPSSFIRS